MIINCNRMIDSANVYGAYLLCARHGAGCRTYLGDSLSCRNRRNFLETFGEEKKLSLASLVYDNQF